MIELFPRGLRGGRARRRRRARRLHRRGRARSKSGTSSAPRERRRREGWEERWRDLPPAGPRRAPLGRAAVGDAAGRRARASSSTRAARSAPARTRRRSSASSCSSGSSRGSLLDVGCGSGVLAIAAALLGFAPVLGVDVETAVDRGDARERGARTASRSTRGSSRARISSRPRRLAVANISLAAVLALPGRTSADAARHLRLPRCPRSRDLPGYEHVERARCRRLGGRRASQGLSDPEAQPVRSTPWRRSASTSSAARSRTSTRTRSARPARATATPSGADAAPTSR